MDFFYTLGSHKISSTPKKSSASSIDILWKNSSRLLGLSYFLGTSGNQALSPLSSAFSLGDTYNSLSSTIAYPIIVHLTLVLPSFLPFQLRTWNWLAVLPIL